MLEIKTIKPLFSFFNVPMNLKIIGMILLVE
jgi:hypothetical protein